MLYCSNKCYQQDSATHNTLCSTFNNFRNSERPTSNHYRAILSPVNNFKPRFIWLRVNGARGYRIFDSNNLARYIPGLRDDAFAISRYADLDREYENTMFLMHHLDLEGINEQPVNQCLAHMIGEPVEYRGNVVVFGMKYTAATTIQDCSDEDQTLGAACPIIALDLDTTSLNPLIAYLG
jgi:hypothetical protein